MLSHATLGDIRTDLMVTSNIKRAANCRTTLEDTEKPRKPMHGKEQLGQYCITANSKIIYNQDINYYLPVKTQFYSRAIKYISIQYFNFKSNILMFKYSHSFWGPKNYSNRALMSNKVCWTIERFWRLEL